ncbi:hypothetical protein [Oceanisphaera avium]|nr:hypothetical protein [Oceanisphaera avium]
MKTANVSNQTDKNAPHNDPSHKSKTGEHKEGDKSKSQDKSSSKKTTK